MDRQKKPNTLFNIASSNCGCYGQTESDWKKVEQFQEFLKVSHVIIFFEGMCNSIEVFYIIYSVLLEQSSIQV